MEELLDLVANESLTRSSIKLKLNIDLSSPISPEYLVLVGKMGVGDSPGEIRTAHHLLRAQDLVERLIHESHDMTEVSCS